RDALRAERKLASALARYQRSRSKHVAIYHFWSRWLTPLFQSDRDRFAACRDLVFHPMSRLPGGRGQMLRALTGTRHGWLGAIRSPQASLAAMATTRPAGSVDGPSAQGA